MSSAATADGDYSLLVRSSSHLAALHGAVLDRVRTSLGARFGEVEIISTIPSVTDFAFRGTAYGRPVVIKCSYGGLSIARLMHLVARGVDVQRMADERRESLPFSPEAMSLRWLSDVLGEHNIYVPQVLHDDGDVVIMEDLGVAGGGHQPFRESVNNLWPALSALWRRTARTDAMRRVVRINAEKSIEAIFRRKFRSRDILRATRDDFADPNDWAVFAGLRDAISGTYPLVDTRIRLIYGDLKPEHLLFRRGTLSLIDPALRLGSPAEDMARFLIRAACASDGEDARSYSAECIESAEKTVAELPRRKVLRFMAMDWLNIISTWHLRRRAYRARATLTPAERRQGVLLQRSLLRASAVDVMELTWELSACMESQEEKVE
ncbi:hypothetical protein AB0N59_04860 [Microbacterium sp. NPDC089321]|uniref:hypothetical protein n=1 Tax=Microbacterium sp. NPDC089321 TaxID=3155183 RepID=UPI00342C3289